MSNRGSPAGTFLAFVMVLLGAMLVAAVLSPWMQWMLSPLQVFPLHRVFSRLTMLGVLAGTLWLLRRKDLARREVLGYDLPWPAFARRLLLGLAAGLLLMTAALAPLFLLGVREWNPARTAHLPLLLLKGLGSGLLVALIEETFFRGAMQTAMTRESGLAPAILLPSVVYAALHFVAGKYRIPASEIDYGSGFHMLAEFLRKFSDPLDILDAFLCLTAVGVLLGLVRAVTGNIAASIGLHAGWVAVILVVRQTSLPNSQSSLAWMIDDHDGFIGWLVLAWTPLMGWILYRWYRKRGAVTSPAAPG